MKWKLPDPYFTSCWLGSVKYVEVVWLWLRESKPIGVGLAVAAILVVYGIVPTLQPANFGRVYAAYGGVFIVLSILWGWQVDRIAPDTFDLIGGTIALIGVAVIMYWPRG